VRISTLPTARYQKYNFGHPLISSSDISCCVGDLTLTSLE
jgi:hypothetical protein